MRNEIRQKVNALFSACGQVVTTARSFGRSRDMRSNAEAMTAYHLAVLAHDQIDRASKLAGLAAEPPPTGDGHLQAFLEEVVRCFSTSSEAGALSGQELVPELLALAESAIERARHHIDKAKVLTTIRDLAELVPQLDAIGEKLELIQAEDPDLHAHAMLTLSFSVEVDKLIDDACEILGSKRDNLLEIPLAEICGDAMVERLSALLRTTTPAARRVLPTSLDSIVSLVRSTTALAQKHLAELQKVLNEIQQARASETGPEYEPVSSDRLSMPPSDFLYELPKPPSEK